ncbi:MAG: hypothetical protein LBH92_08670 [Bacteroidales bacterium]|nr:hypothetical protein [Bacteroidales bacterium]
MRSGRPQPANGTFLFAGWLFNC